uniref:Large ribosomal subunit protein eL24-related N-terminal domain-containing protein n=1 Tax=Phaeomonas parva TaxID=124430 RepID=A0A7S1XMT1_9STRA|mmetsp:Transcript_21021/g.64044  ORF Transcript_21021/g.64044 Transcript_21021/m.64044 type:complete len:155 (+) Transcript_21021:160-624(+)|eukprot:CAMPEP_0118870716 /NCGR_PEP_ID=MMETSP1163-20130328/13573_1 /TAXON_ID=124430 /ORGANISM="Phaeomonas parva, Strain CCMP2877" /LENGTH=154 /DNA_ID=CAMNT_0006805741 /DNA_START=133 /DNA_END=597 /DNA_ORIENTATION=-
MVIKTDRCAFSEIPIYPGHGVRFIRRDGQPLNLLSSKIKSMLNQRKKPAKLTWTQAWRRQNKKLLSENNTRKRTRKTTKFARAIVGVSIEEIRSKRQASKKVASNSATAAALKEAKGKSSRKARRIAQQQAQGPAGGAKVGKNVSRGATRGSQR